MGKPRFLTPVRTMQLSLALYKRHDLYLCLYINRSDKMISLLMTSQNTVLLVLLIVHLDVVAARWCRSTRVYRDNEVQAYGPMEPIMCVSFSLSLEMGFNPFDYQGSSLVHERPCLHITSRECLLSWSRRFFRV